MHGTDLVLIYAGIYLLESIRGRGPREHKVMPTNIVGVCITRNPDRAHASHMIEDGIYRLFIGNAIGVIEWTRYTSDYFDTRGMTRCYHAGRFLNNQTRTVLKTHTLQIRPGHHA